MLVVVPSRGRPANIKRLLGALSDTKTHCKVLIRIDDDDETMRGVDFKLPANVQIVSGEQVKSVGAMNEALAMFPNEDCYMIMGDDCVPRTKFWDEMLRVNAGDWFIAFPDDLLKRGTLATHPVVGAKFIKAIGFWALPGLIHLYPDKAIDTLGRMYGNMLYCPDVIVEHMHFSNGKAPYDATYVRTFKGENHFLQDKAVYESWISQYEKDPAICENIENSFKLELLKTNEI